MRKAPAPSSTLRRNGARIRKALQVCDLDEHVQQLLHCLPPLRVLGLDINTNSTGFAVVTERGRVCRWGHIPTTQFASADVLRIGGVVDDILATVRDAEQQQQPAAQWLVGIEAFMRMFCSGRFHNAGMFQLAQLNGIVSFACWKRFHVLPLHTHPSAARGFFGLSASSKGSTKSSVKHRVMDFLEHHEPEATRRQVASSTALPVLERMRTGALADSAFDIADAYVVASYTRSVHLQKQLVVHYPQLVQHFSTRYLELTHEAVAKGKKNKRSVETEKLKTMGEGQTLAYTSGLFAFGLENWFREHNTCFTMQDDDDDDEVRYTRS